MPTTNCPSCGQELEVEEAYRDWTVRCPHCGREFVPSESGRESRRAARPVAPSRRDEGRDDRYEDERDGDFVDDLDRRDAFEVVSGPGLWLEICGWGTALLIAGICALLIGIGLADQNNAPRGRNNDDGLFFVFLGGCIAVFGVPYFVLMGIGGRHLRNLSSRGWAMAGAILGVALFSLVGFFGAIHTAIGVWALVSMEKPEVRRAFGLPPRPNSEPRRRRRRRRREEWED